VRTTLAETDGQARIQIKQLPGFTVLNVQGRPEKGPPHGIAGYFQMIHDSFNTPGTISVRTSIFARPDYLQIAQDTQMLGSDRTVSLIQTPKLLGGFEGDGAGDGIRFFVQQINNISGAVTVDIKLAATNFAELRRLYPKEIADYLQPIFRDLGQEAGVFAADPKIAWQVFADKWEGDPQVEAKVKELIAQADSDNFQDREAALEALQALGQPAALVLVRTDRSKLSAEQNSRIDTFLAPYQPLTKDEAARLRVNPDFLLSCLYNDDARIRTHALAELEQIFDRKIPFDVKLEGDPRYAAVSTLRTELMPPPSSQPTTLPVENE